jgi:TolA-binding protein
MWKRGNMRRNITSGATLTAMALALSLTSLQPANANSEDELRLLREQLAQMAKRLEELETKQSDTQEQVQKTQENAVITSGKSPGCQRRQRRRLRARGDLDLGQG